MGVIVIKGVSVVSEITSSAVKGEPNLFLPTKKFI